jgi:hypothetical protein
MFSRVRRGVNKLQTHRPARGKASSILRPLIGILSLSSFSRPRKVFSAPSAFQSFPFQFGFRRPVRIASAPRQFLRHFFLARRWRHREISNSQISDSPFSRLIGGELFYMRWPLAKIAQGIDVK